MPIRAVNPPIQSTECFLFNLICIKIMAAQFPYLPDIKKYHHADYSFIHSHIKYL
jgi:hypothetical protein